VAGKKAGRAAKEGCIASYIHHGSKLGVLVEINCETDFVARNDAFRELVKDVTQHIAAANPSYVRREDVPSAVVEGEKEIYRAQVKDKPAAAVDKIVTGKLEKFYSTVCLLEQPFVKNPEISIKDHVTAKIAQLGENIIIRRFTRWQLGEEVLDSTPTT
jgi:elongation factor Ts